MTAEQLPDSLQLRNLFRSLATLDLLVAPAQPSIRYTADPETHTQAATLPIDDRITCTALFTPEGATLTFTAPESAEPLTLASTLEQPTWQSSNARADLPNVLDGTPESAQEWLARRYSLRPDLIPLRQILMSVPLTVDFARELGSTHPWPELRDAIEPTNYPIADEDLPGDNNRNSGANLD